MTVSVLLACLGLFLAVVGAWLGSTLPLFSMFKLAASWGGGDEESWKKLERDCTRRTWAANFLLVAGTALQILGACKF